MGRISFPNILAKVGLAPDKSRLHLAMAAAQTVLPQMAVVTPVGTSLSTPDTDSHDSSAKEKPKHSPSHHPLYRHLRGFLHRYSFALLALGFLVAGVAAIQLGANYWVTTRITNPAKAEPTPKLPAKSIAGFNITVPASELQNKLQTVAAQPATLTVGDFSEPINGDIIKSWLQMTSNKKKTEYYIHVNEAAINASLAKEAGDYAKAPVNQVTVNEDGSSVVVVNGRNGRALSDPNTLKTQAHEVAKTVLNSKGMQFSTPLGTVPFQAVTPAAFDKVLVANVTTKKMWAFQNGQQVNSFLTSDGAPATPTPLGLFHVYAKFTVQDMRGTNPNGTPYFQPKVPWVSYFYSGSAVHGVYWHPLSWFGVNNSSHGCVGLPVDEAQWVFNWAPIGTTVITHA